MQFSFLDGGGEGGGLKYVPMRNVKVAITALLIGLHYNQTSQ